MTQEMCLVPNARKSTSEDFSTRALSRLLPHVLRGASTLEQASPVTRCCAALRIGRTMIFSYMDARAVMSRHMTWGWCR